MTMNARDVLFHKECDELENRCDEWICRLIDCRYFINRGKVTDIKIDKEE